MSNKKTDIGTDFEEKLAEIANKKSRTRTNNNIYERFISRVQNTEDDDDANTDTDDLKKLGDANKLSAYEPLSAVELEGFANLQVSDGSSGSISLDFSDEDEVLITDRTAITSINKSLDNHSNTNEKNTSNNDLAAKNSEKLVKKEAVKEGKAKTVKSPNKQAGSKKPLIIGMIFGSLLIAVIVATLIFTGVLSTSTKTVSTETSVNDRVETKTTTDTVPAVSTGKTVVTDDNQSSANTGVVDKSTVISQPDESANGNSDTVINRVEATEVPTTKPAADAAITYEDFREESQSTLYRETDD
ncbi:hypothetical protein ACTXKB_03780 [Psychrobacter aquimaris]|uniref:hypothetical protein n=1 Tax=Psychrobacter aquimaris TaxID=292733 RepID=UPI003FD67353